MLLGHRQQQKIQCEIIQQPVLARALRDCRWLKADAHPCPLHLFDKARCTVVTDAQVTLN